VRDELQPTTLMSEGNSALRLNEIQEQIGRGEYRVDTQAVADAIIRRLLWEQKSSSPQKRPQGECS
jgi:anti-sigma28 factor (negative regulator of flagellin synthesis)